MQRLAGLRPTGRGRLCAERAASPTRRATTTTTPRAANSSTPTTSPAPDCRSFTPTATTRPAFSAHSGGAFPRIANTNFLGQFGDARVPNLLYIHNQFARGYQLGRFADADFVAYERIDKRENGSMSDADGVTMLFLMNDNYASGQARSFAHEFLEPSAQRLSLQLLHLRRRLLQIRGRDRSTAIVPPGGYFVFSWRSPEQPNVFAGSEVAPITIQQNGAPAGTVTVERKDGRNGDPGFNPYGLPDTNTSDYKYSITLPRVTNGANLKFIARADGSAENILMALDGGVDINSHIPPDPRPVTAATTRPRSRPTRFSATSRCSSCGARRKSSLRKTSRGTSSVRLAPRRGARPSAPASIRPISAAARTATRARRATSITTPR